MFGQKKDWETRENAFAAFSMGPLTDFWRQREEAEFKGVDDVPVRFVRFCAQNNDRLVLICPGRIESYVKYAEVAYDLFHSGFDVMIIDHRGQGRSGRLLSDTHRGHVVNFSDYVDDLAALWQQQVVPGHWRKRFILAHSMGGAIATLFLQRYQAHCDAIALCAPMFGIIIRLPDWMVRHILDWAEGHQRIREEYAIGTGRWRALPFAVNVLTHSRQRYRRNCASMPMNRDCRLAARPGTGCGGHAGRRRSAGECGKRYRPDAAFTGAEERVVDNLMHDRYCELRAAAGHPCEGGKPLVIEGAYHEILFEKDAMRSVALNAIVEFFNRHT